MLKELDIDGIREQTRLLFKEAGISIPGALDEAIVNSQELPTIIKNSLYLKEAIIFELEQTSILMEEISLDGIDPYELFSAKDPVDITKQPRQKKDNAPKENHSPGQDNEEGIER